MLSSLPPKRRFVVKVPVKDAVKADKLRRAKDLLSQLDQSLRATVSMSCCLCFARLMLEIG